MYPRIYNVSAYEHLLLSLSLFFFSLFSCIFRDCRITSLPDDVGFHHMLWRKWPDGGFFDPSRWVRSGPATVTVAIRHPTLNRFC